MPKFYAVRQGHVPGVYTQWSEAQKQVNGYSGAEFKSFLKREEADSYISNIPATPVNGNQVIESDETKNIDNEELGNYVEIYVDGSFSSELLAYGSGWVAVEGEEVLWRRSFLGDDARYIESHQIPGELFACIDAINWAKDLGYESVVISYDYEGIEKWATREWKANKNVSRDYVELYDQASQGIRVKFNKVKAHSGINFNEVADKLAKKALLQRGIRNNNDGGVTLLGIDAEELEIVFEIIKSENPKFDLIINDERNECINYTLLSNDDKIVINCYDSGKTIVQGKESAFMQYTLTLLIQLCEDEEDVTETLNSYNNVEVDAKDVERRFNEVLPNYRFTSNKLDKTLKQAAYNLTIDGHRYDYSDLPMPVLRAIDFYLHRIFNSIGLTTVGKNGKNQFNYFDTNEQGLYIVQAGHQKRFSNDKQIECLNRIYNFYSQHRHTLFHWNEDSEETRLVESVDEAREVLIDGFSLLDQYYICF